MLKSSVLSAVFTIPGNREFKLNAYSMIHLASADELDELAEYSDNPRDIAIYLGDVPVCVETMRSISAVRALHAVTILDTPDVFNNIGRKCCQPWDMINREWVVLSYLTTCKYVIYNARTQEYRMVEQRTMSNLY